MPEVGVDGQRKLKAGSVLCIGAGGLGSPAAMYLAAAGVGRIGRRRLRRGGLQQPAAPDHPRHAGRRPFEAGLGEGSAARHQSARRGRRPTRPRSRPRTRSKLFEPYDVILDGTDNFPTRYLTNDACVLLGKPNAYGSIFRFEGQASVFAHEGWPVLSLPVSRAAAARPRAELRGRRRAGRAARRDRRDSGDRSDQADRRHRRAAHRTVPDLRRAADAFPRAEAEEGSGLPGVRHASRRSRS